MATIAEALAVAIQYQRAGYAREAEQIYRQILDADPGHAEARRQLEAILASGEGNRSGGVTAEAAACNRQAIALFRQGRVGEAMMHFRQAIEMCPAYSDAHCNLGNMYYYQGQYDQAVACYQEALRLRPDDAGVLNNLGNVLFHQGKYDEAVAVCRHALSLAPDDPGVYNNLGNALQGQGRLDEAADYYRQALRLNPDQAEAGNNLGLVLAKQGKLDEAVEVYQQTLRLQPNYAEAHVNLGSALVALKKYDQAIASCRQALMLQPQSAAAHGGLGFAYYKMGRPTEAMESLRHALRLNPHYAEAHHNLGAIFLDRGNLEEAAACYRQALCLKPDYAEAHSNLGVIFFEQGEFDQALACFEQAIQLQPAFGTPRLYRAMIRLLHGDFERGLPEYEWRWEQVGLPRSHLSQPCWDGSPLTGRTILLHAEQGLGDTLHFVRYAPLVKARGGQVLVECQQSLLGLLRTCPGVDGVVVQGSALPPFDTHAPLLSLPAILKTTLNSIPAAVPYLSADPALVEKWRQEIAASKEQRVEGQNQTASGIPFFVADSPLKIGLAWQGKPTFGRDRYRSVPLIQFAPLSCIQGVWLYSLQQGPGIEQLEQARDRIPLIDLGSRFADFLDTAAAIRNLDLVITVDSAVAHCAGALGARVWVLLPFAPDWRWMLDREDSPWYPTMRLFRQRQRGNWDEVIERIVLELKSLVVARAVGASK